MKTQSNFWLVLSVVMGLTFFSACESGTHPESAEMDTPSAVSSPASETTAEKPAPKIIRHAEMRFQVQDMGTSLARIEQAARQHQAIISNTAQHTAQDQQTTDFEFRVPPQQFTALLDQLQKESQQLEYRTLSADDVTMEYVDMAARIKAKRVTEQRYLDLLSRARNVDEILRLEGQLQPIREEIESAEARLRYLADQTSYSTIKLSIYQIVPVSLSERTGFGVRMVNAFSTGWHLLLSLVVALCYVWPLVVLGAGYWLLRHRKLV